MAESLVRLSLDAASRAGIEADAEMATQDPADLLLEVTERRQADLLVVGNKGMGEAKRFRLGSVPDRIAHFAPCDLLIVDTARFQTAQGRSDRLYKGIVAGTDGAGLGTLLPGFGLQHELELLAASGLSPIEVIRAATITAAIGCWSSPA